MKYAKYKETGISWLPEVPDGWEIRRLGSLFTDDTEVNKDFKFQHAVKFNYGKLVPKNEIGDSVEYKDTYVKYSILKSGDIVINGLNLNYDFVSQRVAMAEYEGIITSAYLICRPRESVYSKYFLYLFKAMDYMKMFHGMGTGIRLTLSFSDLKQQLLPVPTKEEQVRISEYLDDKCSKMDRLVEAKTKQIELFKELRQSIIAEAVTKGIDGCKTFKPTNIPWLPEVPKDWEMRPFKSLYNFGKGLPITKENLTEKGVPVVSYGQIHSKNNVGIELKDELLRFVSPQYLETNPQSLLSFGDMAIADTSEDQEGCGNAVLCNRKENVFAGYHTIIARIKQPENAKYLAYVFMCKNWRSQIQCLVHGVKLFSITKQILSSAKFPLPPLQEQKRIVAYLDKKCAKIDALVAKIEDEVVKLKEYRERLVADVVTGQRKVVK